MAQDINKTSTSRSWPYAPIDANTTPQFWVIHETTVKNVATPQETTNHQWTAEIRYPRVDQGPERTKIVIGSATDQASFDAILNTMRQAIVDARAGLGTM